MKRLKLWIMAALLLLSIVTVWSCQQGQEEVTPNGQDVVIGQGDTMGDDDDDDDGDDDD